MPVPQSLSLKRCPHCRVDTPNLTLVFSHTTANSEGVNKKDWGAYVCRKCGGLVIAWAPSGLGVEVHGHFPGEKELDNSIPDRAKAYLGQAESSIHTPAGAVMLAASAVDAMLKNKGYKDGSLDSRIKQAAKDYLITAEMAAWFHEIRLDANDQRHSDEDAQLPSTNDAEKAVEFAKALANFLFILPARVQRGRQTTGGS